MGSAAPPTLHAPGGIEPGTADLDEIQRKKEKCSEGGRGGELGDKGMKYLLNVIISNHL